MNPDTGELRALRRGETMPEGFEALPRAMDRDISRILAIKSRPHTFGPGGVEPGPRVEEVEASAWALWKMGADPIEQGRNIGAQHCADAIRALKGQPT